MAPLRVVHWMWLLLSVCPVASFLVFRFLGTVLWRDLELCAHLASAFRRFIMSWFWLSKLGFHAVHLSLYKYYLCPLAWGFHNVERQIRRTQNRPALCSWGSFEPQGKPPLPGHSQQLGGRRVSAETNLPSFLLPGSSDAISMRSVS